MSTTSVQVKVTFPEELYFFVKSQADRFGLTIASYLKSIALNDVREYHIPTYKMSKKNERNGLKALKEYQNGKTTKITDIDEYFKNL